VAVYTYIILALRRLRQEDTKFKASLGFTVRHCKTKQNNTKEHLSRRWWLRPIIPATQEAEVRRIAVGSWLRQIV
jgi:hypothetical protein